ncbi:hypothetical protein CSC28_4706 [Pseudomonas paraeruginosa]|nr:hypothetical protein CSC28_4706 [Pseudomonas paraeruginosa]
MLREGITAPWSALLVPGHTSRSERGGRAVCAARFRPGPRRATARAVGGAGAEYGHRTRLPPNGLPRPDENQSPATAFARPVHPGRGRFRGY